MRKGKRSRSGTQKFSRCDANHPGGHRADKRQCALMPKADIPRAAQRDTLADVGPREDQEHDRRRAYENELFEKAGMMAVLTMHCHERSPYPKLCRDSRSYHSVVTFPYHGFGNSGCSWKAIAKRYSVRVFRSLRRSVRLQRQPTGQPMATTMLPTRPASRLSRKMSARGE